MDYVSSGWSGTWSVGQPSFKKVRDMISLKFYKALKQNNFPDLLAMSKLTKKKRQRHLLAPRGSQMCDLSLPTILQCSTISWTKSDGQPLSTGWGTVASPVGPRTTRASYFTGSYRVWGSDPPLLQHHSRNAPSNILFPHFNGQKTVAQQQPYPSLTDGSRLAPFPSLSFYFLLLFMYTIHSTNMLYDLHVFAQTPSIL